MSSFKNMVFTLLQFFHGLKDENLQWKTKNLDRQVRLKHARVLAAKALEAELKKKSVQLEHEVNLLRTKNDADLSMFKTRCKQDIKDYKQYLTSLDQLKCSIQASYAHLPEALAFTIHHHAKHLLNQMWESEDFEQKMRYELRLIQFMTTVNEDARQRLEGANTGKLPERTLSLIQQK